MSAKGVNNAAEGGCLPWLFVLVVAAVGGFILVCGLNSLPGVDF